jgi:hypothetical protein
MDLELQRDGVHLPVQLWSTILSQDWEGASATLFINDFVYSLRQRLKCQVEYFPSQLLSFLRPLDCKVVPLICHSWGDVYFYQNTTVIRVFGFPGKPMVLPRYVPLRLGFLEILRQICMVQEMDFPPATKRKGSIFAELTFTLP